MYPEKTLNQEEKEQKLVELLAYFYNTIDWSKMRGRNPHDIFNHRVRAASRRSTIYEASSKLANYFGLQSIPEQAMKIINELRPYETEVLNKLYQEHLAISMMAIIRAKEIRELNRKKREENRKEEENEQV